MICQKRGDEPITLTKQELMQTLLEDDKLLQEILDEQMDQTLHQQG